MIIFKTLEFVLHEIGIIQANWKDLEGIKKVGN